MLLVCYMTISVIVSTDPPVPVLQIQSPNSSSIAGYIFELTCSVVAIPDNLIADPVLMWSGPRVNTSGVHITREALNISLLFSPLYTSQRGVYYCTASLDVPEADVHIKSTQMIPINVQSKLPYIYLTIMESSLYSLQFLLRV